MGDPTIRSRPSLIRCLACLPLLAMAMSLSAQSSGGSYQIDKSSIDGGVGRSQGGNYVLDGTAGQHDAGRADTAMLGGNYAVAGGIWAQANAIPIDLPLFRDGFE